MPLQVTVDIKVVETEQEDYFELLIERTILLIVAYWYYKITLLADWLVGQLVGWSFG